MPVFGVRVIYPAGFLVDGSSFIFFGLLQWVDNTTSFLVLSYIIRFLEGQSLKCKMLSFPNSYIQGLEQRPPGPQTSPF